MIKLVLLVRKDGKEKLPLIKKLWIVRYYFCNNCVIFRSYDQRLNVKLLVFNFLARPDHQGFFRWKNFFYVVLNEKSSREFSIIVATVLIKNICFNLSMSTIWKGSICGCLLCTFKYITILSFNLFLILNLIPLKIYYQV